MTNPSPIENIIVGLAERALTQVLKAETNLNLSSQSKTRIDFPLPSPKKQYTLYAHIPFCESLCPYCSFNRFLYDDHTSKNYFNALRDEMRTIAHLGYSFSSFYIGGGTPTINLEELLLAIDLARELFDIREVSCETNPNHLTPNFIEPLKNRVQRLSVGVQSFDRGLLREMNRLEKFGSGEEILERINFAAPYFESLNVDMIFNFPHQTVEILNNDLSMILSSGAQQVTFYPLMHSSSVNDSMSRSVGKPSRQREWPFFNQINDRLSSEFTPLSAWTFARKTSGMIDEYIVNSEEYVGIGSGAFSYLDGSLYVNHFSISDYMDSIRNGKSGASAVKNFNLLSQMRYWFMVNLFSMNFKRESFHERFKAPIWLKLPLEMLFVNLMGSFDKNNRSRLTRRGQFFSEVIMREFFSGVNNLRDLARKNINL